MRRAILLAAATTAGLAGAYIAWSPLRELLQATGSAGCPEPSLPAASPRQRLGRSVPGAGARAIAAGGNRSCAALNDGSVRCWGEDGPSPQSPEVAPVERLLSQLREPPSELSLGSSGFACALAMGNVGCYAAPGTPAVPAAPAFADFVALFRGKSSACARRKNGEVWCWGRGEPWRDAGEPLAALHLPGLDGADDLTINPRQVCVRRADAVTCKARRELEGLREPSSAGAAPQRRASLLAACEQLSCDVGLDRAVTCWEDPSGPTTRLALGEGVVALTRAGDALCAVDGQERVMCWACAELPRGRPLPLLVSGKAPRAFSSRTECVVENGGTVLCGGSLPPAGNGLELSSAPPHRLAGVLGATDVALDPWELCTRGADGKWTCQPRRLEGSARPAGGERPQAQSRAPEPVAAPNPSARVEVNRFALCFEDGADGAVCRGRGARSDTPPLRLSGVRRIVVGSAHACYLSVSDELWCWGANESGQLGGEATPFAPVPRKALAEVRDAALGLRETCALRGDRHLVCLGEKPADIELVEPATRLALSYQQLCTLGSSGRVHCSSPEKPATAVAGLSQPVTALAAAGSRLCALLADRTVSCWSDFDRVARAVPGTADSVELALGDQHACVRTRAGEVRCFGANGLGQLGRDLPFERSEITPPHGCPQVEYQQALESTTADNVVW